MGSNYNIFGRTVPAYQLSMSIFALLGVGIVYATSGSKKPVAAAPPVVAESSDEEKFIFDYLKKQESSS